MDFKQEIVTTIHDFHASSELMEERLLELSSTAPTAVLIPTLYEELERPALTNICQHLKTCSFVQSVVVCLYAESQEQYDRAVAFFSELPQKLRVIWTNGPRVRSLLESLQEKGLDLLDFSGKGWAVWQGLGIATLEASTIALHDADIITYDRSYPLKLLYPIAEKDFGIAYNKAYYARINASTHRFQGRAVRLFVVPLLAALTELFGYSRYLQYLAAYRYPLSGEFALTTDLALNLRISANWGLEIGMLSEVYRNLARKRIAQIDLGEFDHKHKALGKNPEEGLQKMCSEIFCSLLRTLIETESFVISEADVLALQVKFRRVAQDYIRQYFVDAACNQLPFDRHVEEGAIEAFEKVIPIGFERFRSHPDGSQIPDWNRVLAVQTDLRQSLLEATLADMADARDRNRTKSPAEIVIRATDDLEAA